MLRLEDDNEFEKIKRLLKDLPKVDAPSNFENELSKRINQGEQTKKKESWFDKVFSPKLVPSAALAVTAVIILFLLKGNVSDVEDPFQVMPKLREEQNLKQDQLGTGSDKIIAEETNNLSKREKLALIKKPHTEIGKYGVADITVTTVYDENGRLWIKIDQ